MMPKTDAQMPDQQAANDDAQQSKNFSAAVKAEADMHKRHAKEIADKENHKPPKSETSR
jgi:hypothetical protein